MPPRSSRTTTKTPRSSVATGRSKSAGARKATAPAVASTGRWLVKTEPEKYSIEDLERDGSTGWDGVRNHQARNFMRDAMKPGELVLIYHSNADPTGVAGVAKIAGPPIPDPTAFDRRSPYFDPKSDPAAPTWIMARLDFVERFPRVLPLGAIREDAAFEGMPLLARGQRLSVQTVPRKQFDRIVRMGRSGRFA